MYLLCQKFNICFSVKPDVWKITRLEERLITPRIAIMQLHELPRGGQIRLSGNIVNVPANINTAVTHLSRTSDENSCIALKLKRKLSNKHHVEFQSIRQNTVRQALSYSMKNSDLYKKEGITVDEDWVVTTEEFKDDSPDDHQADEDEWDMGRKKL